MTIIKCRAVGNSQGVIIPSLMREHLKLKKDSLLSASVIEGALVLRPVSARTASILDRVNDLLPEHVDVLEGLPND